MNFKNSAFIYLVLITPFASGPSASGMEFPLRNDAGKKIFAASSSPQSSAPASETKEPEAVPHLNRENPQANGIILAFYHWPDEEEKTLILEKTTAAGLKKTNELPQFKAWIFEWPELQKGIKALKVCDALPDISSLEYCEPDYLLTPDTDFTR